MERQTTTTGKSSPLVAKGGDTHKFTHGPTTLIDFYGHPIDPYGPGGVCGICVGGIPPELVALDCWLAWYLFERRRGKNSKAPAKPTKVPKRGEGKGPASSTDPDSWSSFWCCLQAVAHERANGVGFVITAASGLICVDLDHCLTVVGRDLARGIETVEIAPWALALLDTLPPGVFIERSPSGDGLHVWLRGVKPTPACQVPAPDGAGKIEVYSDAKFICVTGWRSVEELEIPPQILTVDLSEFWKISGLDKGRIAPPRRVKKARPAARSASAAIANTTDTGVADDTATDTDDEDWSPVIAAFEPGEVEVRLPPGKPQDLWRGAWQPHYGSQSEADFALAGYLVRRFGHRPGLLQQLMLSSGLVRDKWETARGSVTYLQQTILRVCDGDA